MQSSKAFKYCKYCKLSDHFIDSCPEILCKKCNERGHPHWKCTKKRNIGHAFDDRDRDRDSGSEGSKSGGGGFNRVGSKSDGRATLYMEVVEEEVKMKKSESQNIFQALDDGDEIFDKNSIFHFLQYKGKAWADL